MSTRLVFRGIVVPAALVALVGCIPVPVNEQTLFMPKDSVTPATFSMPGVSLQEVFFSAADGTRLNGWLLRREEAVATVLFFGGNGFYLVQSGGYLEAILRHPVNAFVWDYRGYGRSEGRPSVEAIKGDALAAYEYVRSRLPDGDATILAHGHSIGTFPATYLATQRELAGLVLEAPATDVDGWRKAVVPWFFRLFLRFDVDDGLTRESNLERIREVRVPTVIVAGSEDFVTPAKMATALYEASPAQEKRLIVVEGGDHNGLYTNDDYVRAYADLVDRAGRRRLADTE